MRKEDLKTYIWEGKEYIIMIKLLNFIKDNYEMITRHELMKDLEGFTKKIEPRKIGINDIYVRRVIMVDKEFALLYLEEKEKESKKRLDDAIDKLSNAFDNAERDEQIINLKEKGLKYKEIGDKFGITESGVCRALKRYKKKNMGVEGKSEVKQTSRTVELSINDAKSIYNDFPQLRSSLLKQFTDIELGIKKPLPDDIDDLKNIVGYSYENGKIEKRMYEKYPNKLIFTNEIILKRLINISKLEFLYEIMAKTRGFTSKYNEEGTFYFEDIELFNEFKEKYSKYYQEEI